MTKEIILHNNQLVMQQVPFQRDPVSNNFFVYSQNGQMLAPPAIQKPHSQTAQKQHLHEDARRGPVYNQEARIHDQHQSNHANQNIQGNPPRQLSPQINQLTAQRMFNDKPLLESAEHQSYSQQYPHSQPMTHTIPQPPNMKHHHQRYFGVPHNSHIYTPSQTTPPQQSMNHSQQQPIKFPQRNLLGLEQPQSVQPRKQNMHFGNEQQRHLALGQSADIANMQSGSFQDPNRLLGQPAYIEDRTAQHFPSREKEEDEREAQLGNLIYEQQKVQMLYSRLEWIGEKFEELSEKFNQLTDQMHNIETEEEWAKFQACYEQFVDFLNNLSGQIRDSMFQNRDIVQSQNNLTGLTGKKWQKRYGQLLGNYQSLQNQLSQAHQQRQERQNWFRGVAHNYERQNEAYKAITNQFYALKAENEQLNLRDRELNQEIEIMQLNLNQAGAGVEEYKKLVATIQVYQKLITDMRRELNTKALNGSSHDFRNDSSAVSDGLTQRKNTIEEMNEKLRATEEKYSATINQLKDQVSERDEYLKNFVQQSKKLNQNFQSVNAENRNLQAHIQQLEKKTKSLNKELYECNMHIEEVQNTMKAHQSQAFSLRGVSLELQRMREEKQKERELMRRKEGDLEELKRREILLVSKIGEMEDRLREQSSKKHETLVKNYVSQIEGFKQNLRSKEAEVTKMKGVLRVKEDYNESLLGQIKKLKDIAAMEMSSRESAVRMPVARNYEYENKLKDVDNEFNSHLKRSLQEQILTLRKQCATKQERIKCLEDNQVQLLARMPAFQRQKLVHDREMFLISTKLQEAQQTKNSLILKNQMLLEDKKKVEKELQESKNSELRLRNQINEQYAKNDESQHLIQAKQKIITQLQAQANSFIEKIKEAEEKARQLSFELIQEKKIENANISQDESRVLIPTVKETNHLPFLELEKENTALKQKIVELCEGLGNIEAPVQPPSTHEVTSQHTPSPGVNISKRLIAFNSRLSKMMNNEVLTPSAWDQERKALVDQYEATIGSLNQRIHELQGTKGHKAGAQSPAERDKTQESNLKLVISPNEEFYKTKLNQLENRNEQLIKINEQIKEKLQSLMKVKTNSTAQYYREHYQKAVTEVEQLREKLKKIAHENKSYKMEAQTKWNKIAVVYEGKIFELQGQMQALNRKIAYLEIGRSKTENEQAQASYGQDAYYPSHIRSNRNLDLNFDIAEILGTRYAA